MLSGPEPEPRRPFHQVALIAASGTLLAWILLAMLVNALLPTHLLAGNLVALALAAALGGVLAQQFRPPDRARAGVVGAVVAGVLGVGLAASQGGQGVAFWASALLLVALTSGLGAAAGAVIARRARPSA